MATTHASSSELDTLPFQAREATVNQPHLSGLVMLVVCGPAGVIGRWGRLPNTVLKRLPARIARQAAEPSWTVE